MKKTLSLILVLAIFCVAIAGCANDSGTNSAGPTNSISPADTGNLATASDSVTSTAPAPQAVNLEVGTMLVYDFGDLTLHAYETKDAIADETSCWKPKMK